MSRCTHRSSKLGALTKLTGVSDQTVRHYERLGLIQSLGRTHGGFRLFDPAVVGRITFIRAAQSVGFTLEAIGLLLKKKVQDDPACRVARELMSTQLAELDRQIQELTERRALLSLLERSCLHCEGPCHLEAELNDLTGHRPLD